MQARETLTKQWDELGLSDEERLYFRPFDSETYTDTLLAAHDEEIAKNNNKLKVMRPLIKKIEQREKILQQKIEFEATSTDPSRLLSRGKRDPGRLLREEKFRKTLQTSLPQLEKDLLVELAEWEREHECPFTYKGKEYLHHMREQKELEQREESEAKARRKLEKVVPKTHDVTQFLSPARQPLTPKRTTAPAKTPNSRGTPAHTPSRHQTPSAGSNRRTPMKGASLTPAKRPQPQPARTAFQVLNNIPLGKVECDSSSFDDDYIDDTLSPMHTTQQEGSPPKRQKIEIS